MRLWQRALMVASTRRVDGAFFQFSGTWKAPYTTSLVNALGAGRPGADGTSAGSGSASATAFGLTFPGDEVQTEYDNIAVTPGASYEISIPIGGTGITLTYER